MPDRSTGYRPPAYRRAARWLHWTVAVAVLLMIPAGLIMTQEGLARPVQDALFLFHKNVGAVLILVIAVRVIYRLTHRPPPLPDTMPAWQKRAAAVSHGVLYALLIVIPISGFVRVRAGGFPIELLDRLGFGPWLAKSEPLADAASAFHATAGFVLIAMLALHIGAALHHALIRRDGVWQRMWPGRA